MRKMLMIAGLLCVLGVAGVQAAGKKPATATAAPTNADALHPCTENCDTREGGYDWAEHYAIASADECKGQNAEFVAGCKDYVGEVARPRQGRADMQRREDGDQGPERDRYQGDDRGRYQGGERDGPRDEQDGDDDSYDDNDNNNDEDDDGSYDDEEEDDDDGGTYHA